MVYEAGADPYCYPGTDVLRNLVDLRDADALAAFEAAMVHERSLQPLPTGRLSVSHYRAIHRHLFQDVYNWAGRYRTVRIAKGGSVFCYPENIATQMTVLFLDLKGRDFFAEKSAEDFSRAAAGFLGGLNAIHPFREGNGRTQNAFLGILAARAGHQVDFSRLDPDSFLRAMIESFAVGETRLADEILGLIE